MHELKDCRHRGESGGIPPAHPTRYSGKQATVTTLEARMRFYARSSLGRRNLPLVILGTLATAACKLERKSFLKTDWACHQVASFCLKIKASSGY
jgi:hypothetical protein